MKAALIVARISHILLLFAGALGAWYLSPPNPPLVGVVILVVVLYGPLLVFLPATLQGDARQMTWLCFLLMFYFCGFVIQAVNPPPQRTVALIRLALTATLFLSAMMAIRGIRQRYGD